MTKVDIIAAIVDRTGFTVKDCHQIFDNIFDIMSLTLETGEQLKIAGFGVFTVKSKNIRKGRNPQTGDDIQIAPRKVLRFRASSVLKKGCDR